MTHTCFKTLLNRLRVSVLKKNSLKMQMFVKTMYSPHLVWMKDHYAYAISVKIVASYWHLPNAASTPSVLCDIKPWMLM